MYLGHHVSGFALEMGLGLENSWVTSKRLRHDTSGFSDVSNDDDRGEAGHIDLLQSNKRSSPLSNLSSFLLLFLHNSILITKYLVTFKILVTQEI